MGRVARLQAPGMARRFLFALSLAVGLVSRSSLAGASEEASSRVAPDEPRQVSITVDPTRPLVGMGMVGGEVCFPRVALFPGRSANDVSLGGWVGVGRMRLADGGGLLLGPRPTWASCNDVFYCDRATVVWVGAQALTYPVGGFDHGLQLGVEASFASLWGTRRYSQSPLTRGPDRELRESGFLPGVVLGYKLVTKAGLTFNPQIAADLVVSAEPATILPRLALNAGWSL